jgi:hypothetical protein
MIGVLDVESTAVEENPISVLVESSCMSASRVAVADKATLYGQGEPASALFLILVGFVKTSHICEDGTEITMDLLKRDEIAGVFSNLQRPLEYEEGTGNWRCGGTKGAGKRLARRNGSQSALSDLHRRAPGRIKTMGSAAAAARDDAIRRMAGDRNAG